jgi:hypothetical protein
LAASSSALVTVELYPICTCTGGFERRVTERFHRRDFGHLDVEMTFDDPQFYSRPFTVKIPHDLLADTDIFEMFCNENEKDRDHMERR